MAGLRDLLQGKRDVTPRGSAAYAERQYMDLAARIPIGISRPEHDRNRIAPPPTMPVQAPMVGGRVVTGDTVIGRRRHADNAPDMEIPWKDIDALPPDEQIRHLRQLVIDYQDRLFRARSEVAQLEQRLSDLRLQRDQQQDLLSQARGLLLRLVHAVPQSRDLHLSGRGFPEEWTLEQMHQFLAECIAQLTHDRDQLSAQLQTVQAEWQRRFADLSEVVYRLQQEQARGETAGSELADVVAQLAQAQAELSAQAAEAAPPPQSAAVQPGLQTPPPPQPGPAPVMLASPGAAASAGRPAAPHRASSGTGADAPPPRFGVPERDESSRVREMVVVDLREYERFFAEDERARVLLQVIGSTGLCRAGDLAEVPEIRTAFASSSTAQFSRSELHKTLSKLDAMGFLTASEVRTVGKGRPPTIYQLSDRGKLMYRTLFGADPVPSEAETLRKLHSSLEHGLFIKDVARALRERGFEVLEDRESCTFTVRVDGEERRVVYDLVARRQVEGKEPEVLYIECEMGTQNAELFFDKCEKIFHHNPSAMYFVCPSDAVMTQKTAEMFDRWVRNRGGRKTVAGLKAYFTTLDLLRRRSYRDGDFWGIWNKKSF